MYYEEKNIDGVWYYRRTPNGDWKKLSGELLIERFSELKEENSTLKRYYSGVEERYFNSGVEYEKDRLRKLLSL